jgi:hypothetical protein
VLQLLEHLNQAPDYLAVASAADYGQRSLVQAAAEATGATLILAAPPPEYLAGSSHHSGGGTADSSSRTPPGRLEFLRTLAAKIEVVIRNPSGQAAISDFWFEQLRQILPAKGAPSEDCIETGRLGLALAEHVPLAKIARADRPASRRFATGGYCRGRCAKRVLHYRRPVLHLETAEPALILSELVAALKAFRRHST